MKSKLLLAIIPSVVSSVACCELAFAAPVGPSTQASYGLPGTPTMGAPSAALFGFTTGSNVSPGPGQSSPLGQPGNLGGPPGLSGQPGNLQFQQSQLSSTTSTGLGSPITNSTGLSAGTGLTGIPGPSPFGGLQAPVGAANFGTPAGPAALGGLALPVNSVPGPVATPNFIGGTTVPGPIQPVFQSY